jgi:hypothetical protein
MHILRGEIIKVKARRDVFSFSKKEAGDSDLSLENEADTELGIDRFEQFNQAFFKGVPESMDFKWLNRGILYRLDGTIVAQITLYSGETVNQDFGYDVEIISKNCGKITEKRFPFSSYLKSESLSKIEVKEGSWIRRLDEESINTLALKIMEYIELWK